MMAGEGPDSGYRLSMNLAVVAAVNVGVKLKEAVDAPLVVDAANVITAFVEVG